MTKTTRILAGIIAFLQVIAPVGATTISQIPVDSASTVKPNMIFGFDDSGSMAYEVLMNGTQGSASFDNDTYNYLFYHGATAATCNVASPAGGCPVPPADAAAQFRSSDYNPLYYDPNVTYTPWIQTMASGGGVTRYPAATATAAKFDPSSATSATLDVTSDMLAGATPPTTTKVITNSSVTTGGTISAPSGDVVSVSGIATYDCTNLATTIYYSTGKIFVKSGSTTAAKACANANTAKKKISFTSDYTVKAGQSWALTITTNVTNTISWNAFKWATYYKKVSTYCGTDCVTAPDAGFWLQKVVIANGTDEMQNFANWFQYARSRRQLLSYAMSYVLGNITGIHAGIIPFNTVLASNTSAGGVKMYDLDTAADTTALLGIIYKTYSGSSTPTHGNMQTIWNAYKTTGASAPIQYACQKNSAFILTDGYANDTSITPTYDSSKSKDTWGSIAPYSTTQDATLANQALAYFTNNPRSDFATGQVPLDTYTTGGGADLNSNLHVNTYALTLGADGVSYAEGVDPYANHPTWATPVSNAPTMIDDLWHATINGRGLMFSADNVNNLVTSMQNAMMDVVLRAGSKAAVAVASRNMNSSNNFVYAPSYNANGWFGDVQKFTINLTTGLPDTTTPIWSARVQLDAVATPATTRKIITWTGSAGGSFNTANSGIAATLVSYLRGDSTYEANGTYRKRTSLFGDIINASPVVVSYNNKTTIYQAANDGMLHAFDSITGDELWAYVPKSVHSRISSLASPSYTHIYTVDGTPTVGKVGSMVLLVGGLGAGGTGFYALDVTDQPLTTDTETQIAAKAKWEFPVTTTDKANMGTSHSRPLIVTVPALGQVVVVSSGYNNGTGTIGGAVQSGGDGKGHVWFLNPTSGAVLKELVTADWATTAPIGMSSLSGFIINPSKDTTVVALYAGDELGNVWKFNTASSTLVSGSPIWPVSKIATLTSAGGVAQPITTAPEFTIDADQVTPILYIGTGRLLGGNDLSNTARQSFYAFKDNKTTTMSRSSTTTVGSVTTTDWLAKVVTVASGTTDRAVTDPTTPFSWATYRGWYVDFPSDGERVVGNPVFVNSRIMFSTTVVSANSCSSPSYLYMLDTYGNQAFNYVENNVIRVTGGKYIGNSASLSPTVYKILGTSYVAVTKEDGSIAVFKVVSLNMPARTVSWKEIIR